VCSDIGEIAIRFQKSHWMRSLFILWSLAVFSSLVFANNGFEEGHAAYERQECEGI
jgi:hypothetical protein